VKGTFTSRRHPFAAFSTAALTPRTIRRERNLSAELLLDRFELLQDRLQLSRWLTSQSFWG